MSVSPALNELGKLLEELDTKLQSGELLTADDIMTLKVLSTGLKKLKLRLVLNGKLNGMQGKEIAEAMNLTPGRISQMFKEAQEDFGLRVDINI